MSLLFTGKKRSLGVGLGVALEDPNRARQTPPAQRSTPTCLPNPSRKKIRPLSGRPPTAPFVAAPHRPRCGRRPTASVGGGLTKWTLLGNPPRGQKDGLPCKHFADEHPRHGRRAHGCGQRAHGGQARDQRDRKGPSERCRAHGFRSVERLQGPEAQGCKIPAGQCRVCIHCCGAHWKRRADADGRVRHHASDRPCWSGGLSQEHGHQPDAWCQPLSCISSHHRAEAACSAQACAGGGRRGRRCGRGRRG